MADTETVRILRIKGQTEGLTEMTARLKDIKAAQEGVAQSSAALAVATETSAKRQLSSAGAWERLAQKYDSASKAQAMFERELRVANRAFDAGKASGDAYVRTVEQMKRAYEGMGAAARAAASIDQSSLNRTIGIKIDITGSARDSAAAMEAEFARLDQVAQMKAAQIGADFGRELSERLIAGTGKAARDSASVFASELDRLDNIAKMKAEQTGAEFGRALNASLIKGGGKSAADSARVFQEQENDLQKLRGEYDQLAVAQERRTAAEAKLNDFVARGLIVENQKGVILDSINKRYEDTARALAGANVPIGKYISGVGLARNELINLSRQAQDVFVSLASGQSPMTVLIQQGTQIADVFAASRGSVAGFFVQVTAAIGPFLPLIAAAGAAVTAFYSAFNVSSQRLELTNSLNGVGRAAGVTGEQLNRLAVEAAASASITNSAARSIAAEFAKTGTIATSNLTRITRLTKDYAASTGQDMGAAAKELASALADPSRGAETLNSKLGFLDSTTARAIRTATDYGDKLRAQKLLLDAVAASTVAAEQAQSKWNQAWEKFVTRPLDSAKEAIGSAVIGPDQRDQVRILDEQIKALKAGLNSATSGSEGRFQQQQREQINAIEARRNAIQSLIDTQEKQAKAQQATVQGNSKTRAADDLLQGVQRDSLAYQLAVRNVSVYEASIGELIKKRNELVSQGDLGQGLNQQKFADINAQIREQTEALEKAKNQVKDYAVSTQGLTLEQEKARRVDEIRLRAVNDITPAQRAATAAAIAQVETLGSATTAAERAAEVEKARRQVQLDVAKTQAEASRAADDNVVSLNAQTEATRRGGVAAAEAARLRAAASVEARNTGGDSQVIFERMLREAIAETNKELAAKVAQNRSVSEAERAATAQTRASGQSEAARATALAKITALEEERRRLIALGVTDQGQLNQKLDEYGRSIDSVNSAQAQARAQGLIYGQDEQIAALRREIELVGLNRDARRELLAILQAEQDLRRANIAIGSAEGQEYVAKAKQIASLNSQLDATRKAYDGIKQAQDFVADGFKSFAEELITGTEGINGALKTLGKGFLSASLDALISGKGPLASITGLASNDNTKQGGVLGLLSGNNLKSFTDAITKGTAKGAEQGVSGGFGALASNDNFNILGSIGIDGKQLAGGLTAIAGLAGAYGIGASASSTGMGVLGGALSGAMAGAAVFGPIGALVGAVAGGGLGFLGGESASKKRKEELRKQAEENYQQAAPQIASLGSQLRGDPQNTLRLQIAEAEAAQKKLGDIAYLSGRVEEQNKLYLDFQTYSARVLGEFRDGFVGMLQSMEAGLGPNSPFAQAKSAIADFGKELQGFIDNAKTAFGDAAPQVQQAREAAAAYALSVLEGGKTLTLVQQRMAEIQGTGAGLVKVLVDLGWESERAGEAVRAGMTMAIQRVRDAFETDLQAKTNDALDKGYLNDARTLLLEIQQLATDSRALGTDPDNITRYFQAAAQNLVDEANLTGDAFNQFLVLFPEFTGNVVAAGRALEDASRRLGYIDRLFNATNDTSTLGGQLAAYDRQAMREREEEVKLGGQYILELEAAQQAERYNIIRDFNKAANDNYRQSLQQAQDYVARFTNSIREYLDGLRAGSDSPLSPQARLAAAQSQYNTQLGLAQGGDRNALDGITGYASDLLDAAKGFYASSTGFQDIFAQIQSQLGALPDQLSAEQFIVNAINGSRDALLASLARIDVDGDGVITRAEATNTWLAAIFNELDINGNNEISKFEQLLHADGQTRQSIVAALNSTSPQATANLLATYFNALDSSVDNVLDFSEMQAALSGMASNSQLRDMFTRIDTDNSGSISRLEAINSATGQVNSSSQRQEQSLATANQLAQQVANLNSAISTSTAATNSNVAISNGILYEVRNATSAVNASSLANSTYSDLIVKNLRSQLQNWGASGLRGFAAPYFRDGGLVSGPGTGTSDSITAHLSNGEFVMRRAAVDRFGANMLGAMNDNFAMPAVPVPMMGGGGDMRAVVVGLEKVTAAVQKMEASNVRATVAAAEHVGDEVKVVASKQEDAARRSRLMAA